MDVIRDMEGFKRRISRRDAPTETDKMTFIFVKKKRRVRGDVTSCRIHDTVKEQINNR